MTGAAEPRKPLTKRQRADMAIEQAGRCGCSKLPSLHPMYADFPVCAGKLSASEGVIDEHLWPLEAGGSNAPDNRALLRKSCARLKTDEYDRALIAKTKHMAGEEGSQAARRARKKERGHGMKSPGFRGHRKFNGEIVWRSRP